MKNKFWFISVFMLLIVCAMLFYFFYLNERERKISEINQYQKVHAKLAAKGFNELLEKWQSELYYLSNDEYVIRMDATGRAKLTDLQKVLKNEITGITRVDKAGTIIFTTPYYPNSIGRNISNQKHMRKILSDHKPVVSEVFMTVQGYQAIAIHYPVYKKGSFDGTIAFVVNFKEISKRILDGISLGKTGYAWMISSDGTELYCPVPGHAGKSIFETAKGFPDLLDLAKRMTNGDEGIGIYHYNMEDDEIINVKKIAYYFPVIMNNTFWSIAITCSEDEITESLSTFMRNLIIVFIFVFISGLLLLYFGMKAWLILKESAAKEKAENELRESEERYRFISNTISDYMFSTKVDEHGNIAHYWVGGAFESISGYTYDEYIKIGGWRAALHPEDRVKDEEDMIKLSKNEDVVSEVRTISKNGNVKWVRVYAHPIWDFEKNRLSGIYGAVQNITEQKLAEERIKASEEKFRTIFRLVPEAITLTSIADSKLVDVNESLCKISGYTKEEIVGNTSIQLNLWKNSYEREKYFSELLLKGTVNNFEADFVLKSGETRSCLVSGEIVELQNEKLIIASIVDISEMKSVEDRLKTFQKATDQSPASIIITNTKAVIEYVNQTFYKMTGYAKEEIIGKPLRILNVEKNLKENFDDIWKIILSGQEWKGEYHNKRKDGSFFWESTLISPIKEADGSISHLVVVQEDISDRKEYELKLMQAKEHAEEASKLKSNFLSNMSHELRTPLVGMLGFSELLADELQGETKDLANMMNLSSKRLLKTLNTILNYSEIEAEKIHMEYAWTSVSKLVQEQVRSYKLFARQSGILLTETYSDSDFNVITDPKMIGDIVDNLLDNAIRFTKEGEVSVSLVKKEKELELKIADSGIGIPNDKLEVIFDDFRQVSEGFGRNFEGTGLGLTIVRKYVKALGGKIRVESELGIGSRFIITLPILEDSILVHSEEEVIVSNEKVELVEESTLTKNTILLVEDDEINSAAISLMLSEKYNVDIVSNANDAIARTNFNQYDIILMDINLRKGLSGIEAMLEIRKNNRYKTSPIVAMTAYAMKEDETEFLSSGFTHYISKPFTRKQVLELVQSIFDAIQ